MNGALRSWRGAAILVALAYLLISVVFAQLDDSPDSGRVRLWRLAAWVACAVVGAAHIVYEHLRLASPPQRNALHVAAAVALGAFLVAAAANVHWLLGERDGQRAPLIALPTWPLITAVPAFLAAFVAATLLARLSRR